MDKSYIKKGTFIRWTANRSFKGWDTYGIITKVTDTHVTIKTFDNFKETEILIDGEAMTEEVSLVTKQEIEDYINKRKFKLKYNREELELEHQKTIREIDNRLKELEKVLE